MTPRNVKRLIRTRVIPEFEKFLPKLEISEQDVIDANERLDEHFQHLIKSGGAREEDSPIYFNKSSLKKFTLEERKRRQNEIKNNDQYLSRISLLLSMANRMTWENFVEKCFEMQRPELTSEEIKQTYLKELEIVFRISNKYIKN